MDLKQIQITGNARDDFDAMKAGKRKRTSRKQRHQEESAPVPPLKHTGGTSPGTLIALQASSSPTTPGAPPPQPVPTTGLKTNPESPAPVSTLTQPGIPLQGGAKPKSKLILEPAQKKKEAMKLAAPKTKHQGNQTRKSRKIRVSISGLGKRMTRHKKIQKEAKAVPLDQIKKKLIEVKLIKVDSKAPEQILRQIYADYETLKNKAL
jgi:hypothetical protein